MSESIHVKMPHCWKSHVAAQLLQSCIKLILLTLCILETAKWVFWQWKPRWNCAWCSISFGSTLFKIKTILRDRNTFINWEMPTYDPLKYIMGNPILIAFFCMGKSIRIWRVILNWACRQRNERYHMGWYWFCFFIGKGKIWQLLDCRCPWKSSTAQVRMHKFINSLYSSIIEQRRIIIKFQAGSKILIPGVVSSNRSHTFKSLIMK